MKRLLSILGLITIILSLIILGCGAPSPQASTKGPITVNSKADTEGALLGQVIVLMLKANGFQVMEKTAITGTPLIRKAILSGEIDIYPEYTGNGAFFFNETESDVWRDASKGYERVKQLDKEQNNIVWLKSAPANNTWAIAIPKALSEKENIKSLEDFATYRGQCQQLCWRCLLTSYWAILKLPSLMLQVTKA